MKIKVFLLDFGLIGFMTSSFFHLIQANPNFAPHLFPIKQQAKTKGLAESLNKGSREIILVSGKKASFTDVFRIVKLGKD